MALPMHTTLLAIRTIVVPTGVTVLLGLRNPPHSWTSTVGVGGTYRMTVLLGSNQGFTAGWCWRS
jgi:hypothetical protein